MTARRLHAFFTGKVQGVGFRQTARRFANALNLTGWVRNLEDGRVELLAEGDEPGCNALVNLLRERFEISQVTISRHATSGEFQEFTILR